MDVDEFKIVLNELRDRYNKFEVSAFIGAGFSKNVLNEFPSWAELLFDMVEELYKAEIVREHKNIQLLSPKSLVRYDIFKKNKVKEIIDRDGYLSVVSKFKEKRGYREAIESYIEERFPSITEEGDFYLPKKGGRKKITDHILKLHQSLLSCSWDTIYTTNYDTLIEYTAKRFNKPWKVINNAYELSLNERFVNHIIKLHGTLKPFSGKSSNFEFDGCHWHRYIISKEDYLNYPQDHEAFTQLMRIALLKGTFCLFGFSGDDPNFIGWLSWVRDVLVKNRTILRNDNDPIKNLKIFLVTIDDKLPPKERGLFYSNHNIQVLPLKHPAVRKILGIAKKDKPKIMHLKFLDFINQKDNRSYKELWGDLDIRFDKGEDEEKKRETIEEILKLKPKNRIITESKRQKEILYNSYSNNSFTVSEKKIIIAALQDTYLYPQYYPNLVEKIEENHGLSESLKNTLDLLYVRYNTLRLSDPIRLKESDAFQFEKILRSAFSLDFKALGSLLKEWNPKGVWAQKKAMFLALFERDDSKVLLLRCLECEEDLKESFYITDLLNIVNQTYPKEYSTVNYENQNLRGLNALRENFSNNLSKAIEGTKEKYKSYDDTSTTYRFGKNDQVFYHSFRFLQFLIDSGLSPSLGFWNIIEEEEWYKIFKNIFKLFPFPALYYSLFLKDDKLLKRIGQDYAYEDGIWSNECNVILDKLLDCVLSDSTPKLFSDSSIVIAQELFVAVDPKIWEDQFFEIWTKKIVSNYSSLVNEKGLYGLVSRALPYIKKPENISKIIVDCLENRKKNYSGTINFFASLPRLFKTKRNNDSILNEKIDVFINEIEYIEELVIAGNLYELLTSQNISVLNEKISQLIKVGDNIESYILLSSAYHADKLNKTLIKSAIINHPRLWDNGLSERGANIRIFNEDSGISVTPPEYIPISTFDTRLKWTSDDVSSIYNRLEASFFQLLDNEFFKSDKSSPIIRFSGLLNEMYKFLNNNKQNLVDKVNFHDIFEQVKIKLKGKRKFSSVEEAILSNESAILISGLNELKYCIEKEGATDYLWIVQSLLIRIVLHNACVLAYCINTALFLLSRYWTEINLEPKLIALYIQILQSYNVNELNDLDADVYSCYQSLVSISNILNKNGVESEHIDKWQRLNRQKRFN